MAGLIKVLASILFLLAFTAPALSSNNVLYSSTDVLANGQSLTYKGYALTLQNDFGNRCNLVLSGPRGAILWQTNTGSRRTFNCNLQLTSYGELVLTMYSIYPDIPAWTWSSGVKSEAGEYALVLNYDGSLKIYGKSIWSSPNQVSGNFEDLESSKLSKIPVTDSTFWSGDISPIGTIIVKDSYKLELGWTCNMTLTDSKSKRVLWYSNTKDITRDCYANLEGNGELRIKYLGGAPLWGNNGGSNWGAEYVLALRPQGLLTVYGPVIWSSNKSFRGQEKIAMVTAH